MKAPLLAALEPHRQRHRAAIRKLLGDGSRVTPLAPRVASVELAEEPGPGPEEPPATAVGPLPSTGVRRSRRRLAVGIGLGSILIAGGAAAWLARGSAEPEGTSGSEPAAREEAPAKSATPAPELPPPRISFEVRSKTPGARVFLDGDPIGDAPVREMLERTEGRHVVRVEAPGYVSQERSIELASPVAIAVDLEVAEREKERSVGRGRRRGRKGSPGLIFDESQLY